MVLVGVRMEGSEKVFLLQNWWRKKQFVEVSEGYLRRCEARIAFVQTPQPEVPDGFLARQGLFAESSDLDPMDTVEPEGPAVNSVGGRDRWQWQYNSSVE
jgi:hypothetical protein